MRSYRSSELYLEFKSTGNLMSCRFEIITNDTSKTSLQPLVLSHRFKIAYKIHINDAFLHSQDVLTDALMQCYEKAEVWRSLKHQPEVNYSDLDTFQVQLSDQIFNDSVIAKFNSNVVERDAIDILDSITVEVKYYTSCLIPCELMKELNYCHYSMLLCHWEHQIPFVFNISAREMISNNMDNMGNISFSLTNSSQLMVKLMRTIDFQHISLTDELEQLSKSSKYRRRKKRHPGYPIQFFNLQEL